MWGTPVREWATSHSPSRGPVKEQTWVVSTVRVERLCSQGEGEGEGEEEEEDGTVDFVLQQFKTSIVIGMVDCITAV